MSKVLSSLIAVVIAGASFSAFAATTTATTGAQPIVVASDDTAAPSKPAKASKSKTKAHKGSVTKTQKKAS